jgi:phosphopantothenoylcysteine decarboxylase
MPNILLGVTGSVAAVLTPKLITELEEIGNVRTVFTKTTFNFINQDQIARKIYDDWLEWNSFSKVGDPILHIELRKWADILVIAPCTMNTLAKITNGLCDNLLTNIVRAWDYSKPFLLVPACNTHMYKNTITRRQIQFIQDMGVLVVSPVEKTLACGDTGIGAMADISDIINAVKVKI